jgi:NAD+ synthase (glutamine-hydrolysing)
MNFTIALAQMDPVLGDLARNIDKHVNFVERARGAGASLVVFPELSLSGYSVRDLHWDLAINVRKLPALFDPLLKASRGLSILAGGVEEGPSYALFNAAFLIEEGKVCTVHRKTYPPTYGMFEELRYFSPGTSVRAFDTALGRIGVLICEDLWHPSLPYILAQDGAQLIATLVASPTRVTGTEERLQMASLNTENHRAYARLLSTYIAFCNRVGYEDGVNFWGGSEVVGPGGDVIASAPLFDESIAVGRIDEDEVRRARRFSRHFLDENPDLVIRELERIRNTRGESGEHI